MPEPANSLPNQIQSAINNTPTNQPAPAAVQPAPATAPAPAVVVPRQ